MTQLTLLPHEPTLREAATAYLPSVRDDSTELVEVLPADERPVNRLRHAGAGALATGELIAILLGTPHQLMDAQRLLETFEGLPGIARAAFSELTHQHGVGPATAAKIQAALTCTARRRKWELGRRLLSRTAQKQQIRSPADAANLLLPEMSLLEKEHLRVILLDTKNQVLGTPTIYVGSVNTNLVRVGEIFKPAVAHNAVSIIVAHNHPTGQPDPSPEDVALTRKLAEAGRMIDIEVLDHLIIGHNRFVSLKERGLGFS